MTVHPARNGKAPQSTDRRSRAAQLRRRQSAAEVRRRRVMAGASLAGIIALISLLVVSPSGGSTDPSTTGPTPPALPCPPSGQSVDAKAMTAPASTSSPGVTWAGVFERIFVKTSMTGAVSKTPRQHTFVAAAGQGTATVNVPVSKSHVHHNLFGKKTKVSNGVAQVNLNLNHSTVERLDSDYERPLPVAVKVTYKLNGNPISASDVKGKSGTVEVDYQLTNTTAKPVKVCFKGFNGKLIEQTVNQVAPIYAYMSLTLPKHVSQFTAPGGFVNADRKGVDPQWFIALFKPLGPTQQTLKLTMNTSKAKIPKATLLLELVQPEALAGSAPATSASAVGRAQAAAAAAAGKVRSDVAALELKAGQPKQPRHSSGRDGSGHGRSSSGRSTQADTGSLSFGTSTSSLAQMQSQIATLGQTVTTYFNNVSAPAGQLIGSTNKTINRLTASSATSVNDLSTSTSRSINGLGTSASRSIDGLTASTSRSLQRLALDLHRSTDRRSLNAIATRAGHLQTMAIALGASAGQMLPAVSALAGRVQGMLAALPTPVADALRLYLLFGQFNRDLDAFAPAVKTTAEFLKLKADVAAGQALAKKVSDAISQLQTQAQALLGQIHTLQSDVMSLQTNVGALVTATVRNAENTTQARVSSSVQDLDARFAADIATAQSGIATFDQMAQQQVTDAEATAHNSVGAAEKTAHHDVTSAGDHAKQAVATALANARKKVTAAELKVNQTLATVHAKAKAALAAAKTKAKQGGQAALAAVQASADQAAAAAQSALTTANNDYANLLGINQQAVAWELPGGNATGASEQEGSLIYTIAGS